MTTFDNESLAQKTWVPVFYYLRADEKIDEYFGQKYAPIFSLFAPNDKLNVQAKVEDTGFTRADQRIIVYGIVKTRSAENNPPVIVEFEASGIRLATIGMWFAEIICRDNLKLKDVKTLVDVKAMRFIESTPEMSFGFIAAFSSLTRGLDAVRAITKFLEVSLQAVHLFEPVLEVLDERSMPYDRIAGEIAWGLYSMVEEFGAVTAFTGDEWFTFEFAEHKSEDADYVPD
jgi:hypothetical protein